MKRIILLFVLGYACNFSLNAQTVMPDTGKKIYANTSMTVQQITVTETRPTTPTTPTTATNNIIEHKAIAPDIKPAVPQTLTPATLPGRTTHSSKAVKVSNHN